MMKSPCFLLNLRRYVLIFAAEMAISLPYPLLVGGLNHIPAPPVESFDAEFAGNLPKGISLPTSWGVTQFYDSIPKLQLQHGKFCLSTELEPVLSVWLR
jgi:hypothetical protein